MIPPVSAVTGPEFGYDLETHDPSLKVLGPGWAFNPTKGYPVGYAVAWYDGDASLLTEKDLLDDAIDARFKSVYLPVRHEGGGNLPEDEVRAFVQPLLADKRRTAVGANMGYDYGWTRADGYEWNCDIDDVQIQAPLLDDARRSYSLNNLLKDYLGSSKSESELYDAAREWGLKDVKGQLWKLPGPLVAPYARDDAARALRLYYFLRFQMERQDLGKVWRLERDLIPVLHDMRKRGVRINMDRTESMSRHFSEKEDAAQAEIKRLTGHLIDPWTTAPQIALLMEEGVPEEDFPLTPKKAEKSVDNVFLKSLSAHDNRAGQIAKQILILRKFNKARSTFVNGMIMEHVVDGRIHSELRALRGDDGGTVSGRFSGSNPSLQVVPARDPEMGPLVRSAFEPEEGEQWAAIDYSSQEPRLAVHFGVKAGITGAAPLQAAWLEDPRADAYLTTAELCGISRKDAKTIKLGVLYGMGGGTLCENLGLPYSTKFWKGREIKVAGPEGEALLDKFDTLAPMDRKLSQMAQRVAKQRGSVRTILGRRAYFPRRPNGEIWFTHKALNRIIQGSAADMTKKAMLDCYRAGFLPLVSVHDELGFSVENREQAEAISEIMSNAIPLEVPVVCDVEVGSNWGTSMLSGDGGPWTVDSLEEWEA